MSRDHQNKPTPEYSTTRQIAEHFQTSERQVRRWIDAGDLVAHRFGRMVRIHRNDRDTFEKLHRCP